MGKRPIKVLCGDFPRRGLSLVPSGLYLNAKVAKSAPGDVIELGDTWRKQKRVLVNKCRVNLRTSVGNFLVKLIYGANASADDISQRWRALCIVEGFGEDAFGDEVWLMETRPHDAELEAMEDEIAELHSRKAELEQVLADARRGIFNHKDIIS